MKIKITGINGYVGQLLSQHLRKKGYQVSGIQRKLLYGDTKYLKEEVSHVDVIINLAGASILTRWTKSNMRRIYKSRVNTSLNLVQAINQLPVDEQPKQIISASAIGLYLNGAIHDERSKNFDNGFVGRLVQDWEAAFGDLPDNIDLTFFRIGVVIGKESQTIKKMLPVFRNAMGGKLGSGKQAFPFIHERDLINAFLWAVEVPPRQNVFNLVAPQNISNKDFTQALSQALHKPAIFSVPSLIIKIVFGKASSLLLKGPVVEPKALLDAGFVFKYPTIDSALEEILS